MNASGNAPRKRRSALGCLVRLAIVLLVLVAALLALLQYGLGAAIEKGAPVAGPQFLGTPVAVSNAHVRLLSGRVNLSGLVIGAPEGFDANVFEMKQFRVHLDTASLRGGTNDPIVIREILVEGPVVTYELKGLKDNLHALLAKLGADKEDEEKEEEKPEEEEKAPGRKVVIDRFRFAGGKVRVAVIGGKGAGVPLPTIELTEIGRKSGGITVIEAAGQLLRSITVGTLAAVKDGMLDLGGAALDAAGAVANAAVDAAGAAADAVGDAAGAAVDAAGDAAQAVGDAVGGAAKAIGSLFGGDKDGGDAAEPEAPEAAKAAPEAP